MEIVARASIIFLVLLLTYVGMGILMWPVLMVRFNRAMRHNVGWGWRRTLLGDRHRFRPFRVVFGHIATVLLWPVAMREV